jgi:hypothetical protein
LARFLLLKREVLVADCGQLSLDNLEALQALRLRDTQPVDFIIGVPGRRYGDFVEPLAEFQKSCTQASQEITGEVAWNRLRLVLADDPQAAAVQQARRLEQIADLKRQANAYARLLEG